MKRTVSEAKLKCRYCQAVFTGSTRLSPEASPAGETLPVPSAPADVTPRYRRLSTRRRTIWPAVIVILGLAGAVVLGAWLHHKYQKEQSAAPTTTTAPKIVKMTYRVPTNSDTTAPAADESPPAEEPNPAEEPAPATESVPDAASEQQAEEQEDPIEVIQCARLPGPAEASATFVGTYKIHSPQAWQWVQFEITIARTDGKIARITTQKYKNIPTGWRGRFHADAAFRFEQDMRIDKVEAKGEPDPNLQGWALNDWDSKITTDDKIHITGEAKNTANQSLSQPVVCCDFFTKQGLYVGTAKGALRGGVQTLNPGDSATYDIQFDPKQAGSSSRLLADPTPRLMGTTKN